MQRVSMGDIAKAAGVSRSTVSRALRNDPQIPAGTASQIRALAERMGYRHDPAFDVLAHKRRQMHAPAYRHTVAFIRNHDLHIEGYIKGARNRAEDLGYKVDDFDLHSFPNAKAMERILVNRGIQGMILPILSSATPLPEIDWNRFAAVACSVDFHHPPFPVVRTNVVAKLELAWRKCLERGYKRIAIILPHGNEGPHELDVRRAGVAMYLLSKMEEDSRIPLWFRPFDTCDSLPQWLEQHRPEAVIAGDSHVSGMVDAFVKQSGKAIGRCSLIPLAGQSYVSSEPEQIGATAMSILHQQLVEHNFGKSQTPFTVVIEPRWVEGGSL